MQIYFRHVSVILNNYKLLDDISFSIDHDEHWAIVGESGSGKSTLAKSLAKLIFHRGEIEMVNDLPEEAKIIFIDQQHQFKNKQNIHLFYHQQRYNSFDTEETLTVVEILDREIGEEEMYWIDFFGLAPLLNKPMIQLSNGENKRLQLTMAMLDNPTLLILDNPFVGLDKAGRKLLQQALNQLTQKGKKILLICSKNDIPACITHVAVLNKGKLIEHGDASTLLLKVKQQVYQPIQPYNNNLGQLYYSFKTDFKQAVLLKDVTIKYNQNLILDKINWTINKGEKWCVSGPNGSGKSTLLSLITADNPQAFANPIWLFDKRKGSGESIWDIKKKIGHVSPELHLFFDKGIEVKDVVASGLFDTIGLFKRVAKDEEVIVEKWMELTGIIEHKNKRLYQLSLGEQRLVMLTRALVKSPPLLILDEPCQGLDENQTLNIKAIIEAICLIKDLTLIYVSHYQDDIPSSINKVLHLEKGKLKLIS